MYESVCHPDSECKAMLLLFLKLILEREEGIERNINLLPPPGIEPTTQVYAVTRNQTCHLLVYGIMLQPTQPSARARMQDLLIVLVESFFSSLWNNLLEKSWKGTLLLLFQSIFYFLRERTRKIGSKFKMSTLVVEHSKMSTTWSYQGYLKIHVLAMGNVRGKIIASIPKWTNVLHSKMFPKIVSQPYDKNLIQMTKIWYRCYHVWLLLIVKLTES